MVQRAQDQAFTVVMADDAKPQGRVNRYPRHSFTLRHRPWEIQPFMLAPVLPGETMKNVLLQSRVVTNPVKNPLVGWWYEQYLFYVKLSDLTDAETRYLAMFTDPDYEAPSSATVRVPFYKGNGGANFQAECLRRVVEEYWRDEGEGWMDHSFDGDIPVASVFPPGQKNWMDSILDDTSTLDPADDALVGGLHEEGNEYAGYEEHHAKWLQMKALNLTEATYEDYLKSHGIRAKVAEEEDDKHIPELLRYVRDWMYPSNTIDPATGDPTSAVSWAITERADKARFFQEPGFIFGCAVARPKVYFANAMGNVADFMLDAESWMPAVLANEPYTSLKEFAAGVGPVPGTTNGYWVDLRDLLVYGDQFFNFDIAAAGDGSSVLLPGADLQHRYPSAADADALFAVAANNKVECDGVANLTIAGKQMDMS